MPSFFCSLLSRVHRSLRTSPNPCTYTWWSAVLHYRSFSTRPWNALMKRTRRTKGLSALWLKLLSRGMPHWTRFLQDVCGYDLIDIPKKKKKDELIHMLVCLRNWMKWPLVCVCATSLQLLILNWSFCFKLDKTNANWTCTSDIGCIMSVYYTDSWFSPCILFKYYSMLIVTQIDTIYINGVIVVVLNRMIVW